jgi:hypothetical protein
VKRSSALAAPDSGPPDFGCEVLVEMQQQLVEPGISKQLVAQGKPPFAFSVKGEELPRRLEWSSSSRELPLFLSTIVFRKRRLRLDEHVHAH